MKKYFLFLLILSVVPLFGIGQSIKSIFKPAHEIGGFVGGAYYTGDLNQGKHFKKNALAYGALVRYYVNSFISLKGNLYVGEVSADDADHSNDFQKERNLNFRSNIQEIGFGVEFNFFNFKSPYIRRFGTPYFGIGLAVFRFNPKGTLDGEKYHQLQPLGTEGQGSSLNRNKKYSLISAALPIEIGYRFRIAPRIQAGLFWGVRLAFTDYLDDVSTKYPNQQILTEENGTLSASFSDRRTTGNQGIEGDQRGNPNFKDYYYFAGINFTIDLWDRNKDTSCDTYKRGNQKMSIENTKPEKGSVRKQKEKKKKRKSSRKTQNAKRSLTDW